MDTSENDIIWNWTVTSTTPSDIRADKLLFEAIQNGSGLLSPASYEGDLSTLLSRARIQLLIKEKKITVDGKFLRASSFFSPGQQVRMIISPQKKISLKPDSRSVEILYEDEHIVVVNKPQGISVHPSESEPDGTLVNILIRQVGPLSKIGGEFRPGVVHRLDKYTSGVMVVCKSDAAHRKLAEAFSRHEMDRRYWALCYGGWPSSYEEEIKIETLVGRNPHDRKKMSAEVTVGKNAVTYIRRLQNYAEGGKAPFSCWVEARLETGRTHQVRVHLTHKKHSVMGDTVYGQPTQKQRKWLDLPDSVQKAVALLPGQALHARHLRFDHPITGTALDFEGEPPEVFRGLMNQLTPFRI